MDFDKPKWVENNDIFNIQEIKNKNSENAKRFAEDNSTILSEENTNFEWDKKILDWISDINGTLAAQKRDFDVNIKEKYTKEREETEIREVENPNESTTTSPDITTNPWDGWWTNPWSWDEIGNGPDFWPNTTPWNTSNPNNITENNDIYSTGTIYWK